MLQWIPIYSDVQYLFLFYFNDNFRHFASYYPLASTTVQLFWMILDLILG